MKRKKDEQINVKERDIDRENRVMANKDEVGSIEKYENMQD